MTKYEPGTVCWLTIMGEGYPSRYCIIKDKLPFNKYKVIFCNEAGTIVNPPCSAIIHARDLCTYRFVAVPSEIDIIKIATVSSILDGLVSGYLVAGPDTEDEKNCYNEQLTSLAESLRHICNKLKVMMSWNNINGWSDKYD